ncbi:uncharacterized protein PHACADRAFT_113812 [Phanerochaete carnosa HHB-10118-sp]|uniref:Guanylate-binding protein N-terminal domain-containing protein n=1 Tax=Phanerochaete carnosa (strain HHB-10118-sp) TaxID=650164 RepID=K5V919_PHACS|nr:uncharacterized protein PHACADRAFT_113812 [Phanerochaete carnosa HHB-10118-sp]EKM59291.1 hypothetical protein PHACADRAFT_113812 [Phanerochaete carnosa HHB-10118-sp]
MPGFTGRRWFAPTVQTSRVQADTTDHSDERGPATQEWVTVSPTASSREGSICVDEDMEAEIPNTRPFPDSPVAGSLNRKDPSEESSARQSFNTPPTNKTNASRSTIGAKVGINGATAATSTKIADVPAGEQKEDLPLANKTSTGRSVPSRRPRPPYVASKAPNDIVDTIPGMYRILDLVNEQGSGGLVDKVIISQDSFGRFANDISPGAYQSMTHINFKALDDLSVRPIGIYGPKSEILRYIKDLGLISRETAQILLSGKDDMPATRALRSGLYLLRDVPRDLVYVIFWPQDATWNDDAISSVIRNRITFMRYLTKIADQIVALVPDDYSDSMVLAEEAPAEEALDLDDDDDRLFTFQVKKTREEEENVIATEGFQISNLRLASQHAPDDPSVPAELLCPRIVPGDSCLGVMSVSYEKAKTMTNAKNEDFPRTRLLDFIKKGSFVLSGSLSEDAFSILVRLGLPDFAEDDYRQLKEHRESLTAELNNNESKVVGGLERALADQNSLLVDALHTETADAVARTFGVFRLDDLRTEQSAAVDHAKAVELLEHLSALHPDIQRYRRDMLSDYKLKSIQSRGFSAQKERLIKSQSAGSQRSSASDQAERDPQDRSSDTWASRAKSFFVPGLRSPSDADFLRMLPGMMSSPELAAEAQEAFNIARQYFTSNISSIVNRVARKIEELQRDECRRQLQAHRKNTFAVTLDDSRKEFIVNTQDSFVRDPDRVFVVENVRSTNTHSHWSSIESYRLFGVEQWKNEASLKHAIDLLQLTETDKQAIQLDKTHVPTPRLPNSAYSFNLTLSHRILFIQLLRDSRCLLITRNEVRGDVSIYLERLIDLDNAVKARRSKKTLSADKLHGNLLFSFDETKRILAVCTTEKFHIHPFVFDEHYRSLQGLGSTIDFVNWYEPHTVLTHMVFRCADEELLLVDSTGRARILSLTTQQFRPASLQMACSPRDVKSSPDGSCFFSVEALPNRMNLQAYHWASFGSTQGISIELPAVAIDSLEVTSFVDCTHCHVVILDIASASMHSKALHISHKSTELSFRADDRNSRRHHGQKATAHNAIIDCYRDVWTRFPVVPAVRRHTFKSSQRARRSLTFVSPLPSYLFSTYFSDMISSFERVTRKPVENELSSIAVSGVKYPAFMKQGTQAVSQLRVGEWLVDILCLIPIHIAVARDNRFVPLKDGVWSPDFERALLGATVEQVVDKLSFGWYESIFQSYMATKPVRVVSSIGEQSVGKSFALNHLADTSFAGSAMRTTEGVWMSVTPTDECLIVALDFEGVHSIERSAQEDSLLVLFNTAISNLVLFRNNFALSRDIAGLFQSFQSSASVLDPAANPSLFKSELVIIIKDVVDSDMREITKEFSLKFQQIVQAEQEGNFISRLHGGKLAIIPWPVIESRQFYTLFTTIKNRLGKQPVSHSKAGIFLQMMKTLMAKLKANDWGALDQNLATHRALHLQDVLSLALQFGMSEVEPEHEPLKASRVLHTFLFRLTCANIQDIDNGVSLALPNGVAMTFYLPAADGSEDVIASDRCLMSLRRSWDQFQSRDGTADRDWIDGLDQYLEDCVKARIEDVQYWLDVNTSRFNSDTTTFQALRRQFEALAVALRASVQLCKLQCAECQLYCVKSRHHAGGHDCDTSHHCMHACAFPDEHAGEDLACGLP